MQKFILIRFGNSPSPAVSQALKPHIQGPAFAGPIPGAIMSVFNSSSEESQIAEAIKETGATFFLMKEDAISLNLPDGMMEAINQVLGTAPQAPAQELTLDDVLDKISASGFESLTPAELDILTSSR